MNPIRFLSVFGSVSLFLSAGAASAQSWTPGSEIVGQTVQVESSGTVNSIMFQPGGNATIVTPSGRSVPATWSAANGQMCLNAAGTQECWPYQQAFQAGQPMSMTSSCNASSRWLANATNEAPNSRAAGERG
jgi:hypothetical protein